jgi:hypothetical protein
MDFLTSESLIHNVGRAEVGIAGEIDVEDLCSRVIAAVNGFVPRAPAGPLAWAQPLRSVGFASGGTSVWSLQTAGRDRRSQRIDCYRKVILAAIERQADITLVERAEMPPAKHGASLAASTIWRLLDRHAVTFMKTAHASEQTRLNVAAPRQA